MVKHKSRYSCERAIYFYLNTDTIKENCNFKFYYNKMDITSTVLDGGNEIILANWPNDKHIICNINNDISIRISSHPYVLVNRSVLCNCGRRQIIIIFLNLWLHVIMQIPNKPCTVQSIPLL